MGLIVYKTLIRLALTILILIFFNDQYPSRYSWIISSLSIFFIVFYPAFLQYKKYVADNKKVLDTICSSCKHFDYSAFLCMKHDKHISEDFIPCEGMHWEKKK